MATRWEIAGEIVRRDRAFAPVVSAVGPPPARRPSPVAHRFASLIQSITHQLLATSAAATIHARVVAACDGDVSVAAVLRLGPDGLRAAGLSRAKATAMVELATYAADQRIRFSRHGRMSDAAIIAEVTRVPGIGPWTTQMYLMNTLGRHDVWPVGDYGVRQGWSILHGLDDTVSERQLSQCGADLVGLRSEVAWYCWRAVEFARANG